MSANDPTEEVPHAAEAAAAPAPAEQPAVAAPEPAAEVNAEPATAVDEKPAVDAPSKRGRKRKGSGEDTAANGAAADEPVDGGADAEAKPSAKKKKKAPPSPAAPKRKPGRPKKTDKNESDTEDELETELNKRVEALPEDVRTKYGTIVWARMVSYPFWPALIVDPRRINNPGLQASALKELDTKYLVCFYQSRDFYPVLIKNVVAWDDTKFNYREGHPAKDAKAPKRRSSLMAAIELADKDVPLPVDERMDGIMKAAPPEPAPAPAKKEKKTTAAAAPANGEKRKPGRPLGSKNKPKTTEAQAAADAEGTPAKAKRGRKQKEEEAAVDDEETEEEVDTRPAAPPTPEEEEEDNATPALSKEEIKAKVASRKAPSKKKTANADDKAAVAATKQSAKALAKAELDSKRKKEIELVVPQKTVKSADIREATAEAARKKIGGREKPKDKGEYKVGNLAKFAGKMTRLHANESSKNNDELIQMLTGLFEEKLVYRSDMERSGVAAIIAALRKSSNPTVGTTASAVRKHLMKVLNDDVAGQEKKNKAEGEAEQKPAKKLKTEAAAEESSVKPAGAVPATTNGEATTEVKPEQAPVEVPAVTATEVKAEVEAEPAAEQPPVQEQPQPQPESTLETEVPPAAPTPAPTAAPASTGPKPDPSGDKGRMMCIDMLKKALAPIGEKSESLALQVEEQVFDRFKESNDDYRACARSITFGLKKSAQVRERLTSGSLHALELAYDFDRIFKEA